MRWFSRRFLLVSGVALFVVHCSAAFPRDSRSQEGPAQSSGEKVLPVATPNQAPSGQAPAASGPATESTQSVISIHGLCEDSATDAAMEPSSCLTVVTREQFEELMNSINLAGQSLPPAARRNLAQSYVQFLAFERAARKAGLEDTAQFAEIMRWLRLRTASDLYRRKLGEEFRNPPKEEIDAYYKEHLPSYDRVTIARILVPRKPPSTREDKDFAQKALEATKQARDRAAKGDDPDEIQKDAYASLGLVSPPPTAVGTLKRSDFLPEESEELFSLKTGEVSKVELEAASYVVYKITRRETLPESKVEADIAREISRQKFEAAVQKITGSLQPEYNDAYFGPPGPVSRSDAPSGPTPNPHPH
jgi:PPIC-type PPIASE domain